MKMAKRTIDEIRNEILDYFENNEDEFNELIEELDAWNGYLGDDRYYNMDELDDLLYGKTPSEVIDMVTSDFNRCDNYVKFTIYGMESTDCKDYSDYLDDNFIDEIIDNANHLDYIPDEVQELLDELEEAENEDEEEAEA
jgi:uncharacterized protein with von Willebrand factor type A (vWA) domain